MSETQMPQRTLKPAYNPNGKRDGWELWIDGVRCEFFGRARRAAALAALREPLEGGESYWIETTKFRKARGEA